MDSWKNNQNNAQEPDVSVSGQFGGSPNPYQDQNVYNQNTGSSYSQPQSGTDSYGQQGGGNGYAQNQAGAGNGYGQPQNMAGAGNSYGQGQNNYAYGQPFANYNQPPFQGSGFAPTEMEEPVGVGEWVGLLVLATFVPCIGVILMLVWAFGNTEKKSKSNFCKAFLIIWLIKLALTAILFIVWGTSFAAMVSEF